MTDGAADSAVQLGRGIRKLRKQKGWTQNRLAEKANINRASLNALELGKSNPSFILVESIAGALSTTVSGLVSAGRKSIAIVNEDLKPVFALNVISRRKQLNLTRKQLSNKVDMLPQYISTTENGRRLPSIGNAIKLAKALEVPVSSLISPGGSTLDTVRRPHKYIEIADIQSIIRTIREERNLTLDAVSKMTEIGLNHLVKLESKHSHPTLGTIVVFCDGMKIKPEYVLDDV